MCLFSILVLVIFRVVLYNGSGQYSKDFAYMNMFFLRKLKCSSQSGNFGHVLEVCVALMSLVARSYGGLRRPIPCSVGGSSEGRGRRGRRFFSVVVGHMSRPSPRWPTEDDNDEDGVVRKAPKKVAGGRTDGKA